MQFATDSGEAVQAYIEAENLATRASQPLSSVHLLMALFAFPNRAQVLLLERGIDVERVRRELGGPAEEPKRTLQRIKDRARDIAQGSGAAQVDCLHVLIAISRLRDTEAYRVLQRTGTSLTALRNVAVSYVTGTLPRRFRGLPRPERPEMAPAPKSDAPRRAANHGKPAVAKSAAELPEPPPTPLAKAAPPREAPPVPTPPPSRAAPRVEPTPEWPRLDEIAPTLASCGVDLTEQARAGLLDVAIGRSREVDALIDVLGKRRANNPVLVGPPGVGKTAIVEGLAVKIARNDPDVASLAGRTIVALDTGALVAGTSLRGAFSERLGSIKAEVAAACRQIIVFIDELHTLIGAGTSGEGPQDAANELKAGLARGEFPCIGATTADEFKRYIEKDPALERRFSPISVDEPTPEQAIQILEGAMGPYAEHHQLDFSLEAICAAVTLSHRFITERKLPDKAFAVIDLAGSRARRRGARRVERLDVAKVIHEWSGVPLERLVEADAERFANAEALLARGLVGHSHVVAAVARALRRGFAGFNEQRPMGSFLFLGPTGVGKTELVKILAEFVFGRRDAIVRFDMSELSEKHAVARLIGAQPGYIGYEEGGQLTEALRRRPFQIVLFDEVEKAHPDVLNLLLQLLDEGHLTDSHGRRVSFANTVVVLTSNLGATATTSRTLGFGGAAAEADAERAILDAAQRQLSAELWGRLEEKLVFLPLTRAQVEHVAALQLDESAKALFSERQVHLTWDDAVVPFLLEHGGYSPDTGARGMRQAISRHVEAPVAELILAGKLRNAAEVRLSAPAGAQHLTVVCRGTKPATRRPRPSPKLA